MADAHAKHHDYHLVDPSPWPAVGSISAFILAVGAITWMHHMFAAAPLVFGVGVLGVLYTMIGWWRDVIREAEYEGYHTRVVQISHRYGMILFIASEVMFFVAWFWAYFNTALFPGEAHEVGRARRHRRRLAAEGHRDLRSLAPAAAQHADPAHLGHHGDLGASRAAGRRPPGPEMGPDRSPSCSASPSPACRPTNIRTRPSTSAATSTAPPSSWRPASTARM